MDVVSLVGSQSPTRFGAVGIALPGGSMTISTKPISIPAPSVTRSSVRRFWPIRKMARFQHGLCIWAFVSAHEAFTNVMERN